MLEINATRDREAHDGLLQVALTRDRFASRTGLGPSPYSYLLVLEPSASDPLKPEKWQVIQSALTVWREKALACSSSWKHPKQRSLLGHSIYEGRCSTPGVRSHSDLCLPTAAAHTFTPHPPQSSLSTRCHANPVPWYSVSTALQTNTMALCVPLHFPFTLIYPQDRGECLYLTSHTSHRTPILLNCIPC